MNFMLFLIKFIEFKQRIKFKKFELHNYGTYKKHNTSNAHTLQIDHNQVKCIPENLVKST